MLIYTLAGLRLTLLSVPDCDVYELSEGALSRGRYTTQASKPYYTLLEKFGSGRGKLESWTFRHETHSAISIVFSEPTVEN